jgi:hypothetical protein
MGKIQTSTRSRLDYLRRLSVVWASPLRLKIVTELNLREMSPKQFHAEFGGGSISRVDKNFKRLTEYGWLRYIRSAGPGGSRRGAREHFYRATELAVFDDETWALIPYSMRVAISWTTFKQLTERIGQALAANTLTAGDDHVGWKTVALDQVGWERVVAAMAALFESIFEEQDDAKIRIYHSGEGSTLATVGLVAFESATMSEAAGTERSTPRLIQVGEECPVPFSVRVSKVFADDLCLKIIDEANLREISAPQFYAEFGGDTVEGVRRRFKMLENIGWLKKVGEKTGGKRRSAVELFYQAAGPAIYDKEAWAELPASLDPLPNSWTTFSRLAEKVKEAIVAGTFEARLDNHFSWSLLRLDQEGWEKVVAAIDDLLAMIRREQRAAKSRIAKSGETPIMTTVAVAAFESPRQATKEP